MKVNTISGDPENNKVISQNESEMQDFGQNSIDMSLLKLDEADFPDICTMCESCMSQLKDAINHRANVQIKDKDIADEFALLVTTQLLNLLTTREKQCTQS